MRVNFTKVLSALNAENAVIDKKLEGCQDRISRLSKLTLSEYGLQGKAYTAVEDAIHSRAPFLRAQWNVWEALRNGNSSHLAAINRLRGQGMHDEIDTDKLLARLWECYRQIAKCRDSQNALLAPKPEVKADSSIRLSQLTEGSLTLLEPLKTELQKQLDLFYQYQQAAASFYAEAEAKVSLLKAANADAALLLSGGTPQMEWVDGVERDYAMHHTEDIKKFMTPAQYKALMAALGRKRDGSVDLESLDPKKLYSNGKLNEDLWKALYALPKAYITDGMAAAGVRAIEEMVLGTYNNDNPDYKSIQTVLKWAFPSDGKITSHTPGVQPVTHTGFYVPGYGHKKGPFLSCMVKVADDLVRSGDTSNLDLAPLHYKGKTICKGTWMDLAMVGQMLRMVDSIKPTTDGAGDMSIWTVSNVGDEGLLFNINFIGPKFTRTNKLADLQRVPVRMVIMKSQSYIYSYNKRTDTVKSMWQDASIVGSSTAVSKLLQDMQKNNTLEDYSFWSGVGQCAMEEVAKKTIGFLIDRFPGMSLARSIAMAIDENEDKKKLNKLRTTIDTYRDIANSNPALIQEGVFAFTFSNLSLSQNDAEITIPSHSMFIPSQQQEINLRSAIACFNAIPRDYCVPSSKPLDYDDFIKGMAKPLALDGYVPAFLDWCKRNAVLVYKYDVVDIHGVMHHRGDEVKDIQHTSNYEFITCKDSRSFCDYELKSDFEAGR